MTLRLVLDTNVWLDWLVFEDPGIAPLRADVAAGRSTLAIDEPCFVELERVLAYTLRGAVLSAEDRARHATTVRALTGWCTTVSTSPLPRCSDPDDQKFLELARNAGADVLLTKDLALLALARRRRNPLPFRVLRPADYAALQR